MKKFFAMTAVLGLVAGSALATPLDRSNTTIYQGVQASGSLNTTVEYSNMDITSGFFDLSTGLAGGYISANPLMGDDYVSINAGPTFEMESFKFVGGVTNAGGVLFFEFWTGAPGGSSFVSSFGVQLPSAGDFIWTIGSQVNPIADQVPAGGQVRMWADTGAVVVATQGNWGLGVDPATIGTTGAAVPGYTDGSGNAFNMKFEITQTPEPTSLALLGLGVMTFVSRRRR